MNVFAVTVDARNHGDSPHTPEMTYSLMAADLAKLVRWVICLICLMILPKNIFLNLFPVSWIWAV